MGLIIWLRNLVFIVLILSAVYAVLSISGRYKARKRLQAEYEMHKLDLADKAVSQKDFIAHGLTKYDKSMRPKLVSFVFIVPTIIIAVLIYLAQSS